MSIGEWPNKQIGNIHAMGCYSAFKRNKTLIPVITWVNFEKFGKWNKAGTKGKILSDSTNMMYPSGDDHPTLWMQLMPQNYMLSKGKNGKFDVKYIWPQFLNINNVKYTKLLNWTS